MATFDTPSSRMTQYDRPKVQPVQQGPRPGQPQPPSPGRQWVQQCMSDKATDLRKKLGG